MKFNWVIEIVIILILLQGCAARPYTAPIQDAEPIPKRQINEHVVAPGETLYSIALKYDLDYEKLSRINGLNDEYAIRPGQRIRLDLSAAQAPVSSAAEGPASAWEKIKDGVSDRLIKSTSSESQPSASKARSYQITWQWPLSGKVLEVFSGVDGLNKGIDIRGKLGEPVLAAADGEVVYSGSGLRGYGKLIIVKHSERYLSAYAHNRVIHVREGEKVKAGQEIAEVGFNGTNTAQLHFEIRLDGKPVDPLRYLPGR